MPAVSNVLERTLKRDRIVTLSCLAAAAILCWLWLISAARDMSVTDAVFQPGSWSVSYLLMMVSMWIVMMTGMMLPSAAPVILLYARVCRKKLGHPDPLLPSAAFALGYLAAWGLFGIFATLVQKQLELFGIVSAMSMRMTSSALIGLVVLAAGVYQLTPIKDACLRHCRNPVEFLGHNWRHGWTGALAMGLHHGIYCIGCCWVLMALLFAGGVMNLFWIGVLTIIVLLEKTLPMAPAFRHVLSAALIVAGAGLTFSAVLASWGGT